MSNHNHSCGCSVPDDNTESAADRSAARHTALPSPLALCSRPLAPSPASAIADWTLTPRWHGRRCTLAKRSVRQSLLSTTRRWWMWTTKMIHVSQNNGRHVSPWGQMRHVKARTWCSSSQWSYDTNSKTKDTILRDLLKYYYPFLQSIKEHYTSLICEHTHTD